MLSPTPCHSCRCWNTNVACPDPWGTLTMAVVRIPGTDGMLSNHLVVSQVHKHIMGESAPAAQLSDKTFKGALSTRKITKATDRLLMARLRELGAAPPHGNNMLLAPVQAIQKALMKLNYKIDLAMSFTPLITLHPPPPRPPVSAAHAHIWSAPSNPPHAVGASIPSSTNPPQASATPPPPPTPGAQPSAAPPPPPPQSSFPTTLPAPPALYDNQRREYYNLMTIIYPSPLPQQLGCELASFDNWSSNPIQLDRDTKYKACQEVTLETTRDSILGYMGFIYMYHETELHDLSLYLYRSPSLFATFVSYLLARGLGRGSLSRQITTAKKVCSYLNTLQPWAEQGSMEAWLTRLDQQVPTLIPKQPPPELPPAGLVFTWVDGLVEDCILNIQADLEG